MWPGAEELSLTPSARDFIRVVAPAIGKALGPGQIISTEIDWRHLGRPLSFAESLLQQQDVLGGIDAWHVQDGQGMRGIASRVQWWPNGPQMRWRGEIVNGRLPDHYLTFTIRKERASGRVTEYTKRFRALQGENTRGYLFPWLTVQAYVARPSGSGPLLAAAVAQTRDVIAMVAYGKPWETYWMNRVDHDGEATFFVVSWADMLRCGKRIVIVEQDVDERVRADLVRSRVSMAARQRPPEIDLGDGQEVAG